jgi:hypothetical protein
MRHSPHAPLSQGDFLHGISAAKATEHFGITPEKLMSMIRDDPFLMNASIVAGTSGAQVLISPHRLKAALDLDRSSRVNWQILKANNQLRRFGGISLVWAAPCLVAARLLDRNGHHRPAGFLRVAAFARVAAATGGAMVPRIVGHCQPKVLS